MGGVPEDESLLRFSPRSKNRKFGVSSRSGGTVYRRVVVVVVPFANAGVTLAPRPPSIMAVLPRVLLRESRYTLPPPV